MTKTVRTAAVALLAALALAGCSILGSSFDIKGTWMSVGDKGWGQAQPGAVVIFDGQHANLYSPGDAYALVKDGDNYKLTVTGLMGDGASFTVKVIDNDNIELYQGGSGDPSVVLKRAE